MKSTKTNDEKKKTSGRKGGVGTLFMGVFRGRLCEENRKHSRAEKIECGGSKVEKKELIVASKEKMRESPLGSLLEQEKEREFARSRRKKGAGETARLEGKMALAAGWDRERREAEEAANREMAAMG
ncbi:hypothetical protein AMTR_s00042p00089230 [Amborella trichopoda]|uniref:Uncharacterized protein n=1 Tax=Amborella trichopoda TaxID=13333 RepID=W1P7A9_AMBTC|nr:hypothetical protein AMTR_s00042p00089230 [Amborella trichopoda]